jgi:hypothetical protein
MTSNCASFNNHCLFVTLLLFCPLVASAQTPAPTTFMGPPPSQELKALQPLVGSWTFAAKIKLDVGATESYESQGHAEAKWVHNGNFLQLEGFSQTPRGRFSWTEMLGYDASLRQYRRFVFSSEGVIATSVGTWNDKERTMTWNATGLPVNWSGNVTMRFEQDRAEVALRVANERGEVTRESTMTMEREK